jgi:hypothetical protein
VENVQKYFTRRVFARCDLNVSSYSERLSLLNLETLECRRLKADLIMCFKIVNGMICLDFDQFFMYAHDNYYMRGHAFKLAKPFCKCTHNFNFLAIA